mmetsp:Transcript_14367/g.36251  ORF Transcript_14367/g.36251 Transcript_14367/m.36251 type:complete len:398 (-) Transcript_14367:31-1224(-)
MGESLERKGGGLGALGLVIIRLHVFQPGQADHGALLLDALAGGQGGEAKALPLAPAFHGAHRERRREAIPRPRRVHHVRHRHRRLPQATVLCVTTVAAVAAMGRSLLLLLPDQHGAPGAELDEDPPPRRHEVEERGGRAEHLVLGLRRQARDASELRLVRAQDRHEAHQLALVGEGRVDAARVEDDGHAALARDPRHAEVDALRNLALQQHRPGPPDGLGVRLGDVPLALVRPAQDHDGVLARGLEEDVGGAGRAPGHLPEECAVDGRVGEALAHEGRVRVLAALPDEAGGVAQACRRRRLVRTLAAGEQVHRRRAHGLAGQRQPVHAEHEVRVHAAHDDQRLAGLGGTGRRRCHGAGIALPLLLLRGRSAEDEGRRSWGRARFQQATAAHQSTQQT